MQDPISISTLEYRFCESSPRPARPKSFHLPDMAVHINFEKGQMFMEGNWAFMVKTNIHNHDKWVNLHNNRVVVETKFTSATPLMLVEDKSPEMVFQLEGYLNDGLQTVASSGLLIVNKDVDNSWHADIYLFNYQFDVCEIHFNIPLYIGSGANHHMN